jgi:hypothetical protein
VDPSRFAADGHWLERFGPSDWLTPERIAGDRQLLDRMWALLDTLPEAQRAVILLRDVEGHGAGARSAPSSASAMATSAFSCTGTGEAPRRGGGRCSRSRPMMPRGCNMSLPGATDA